MRIIIIAVIMLFSAPAFALEMFTPVEQGAIIIGKTHPQNKIYFNNERIKTTNDGRFIIGVDRDAPASITIKEVRKDSIVTNHKIPVKKVNWKIQRIDGLPPAKVTAPAAEMPRIEQERKVMVAAKESSTTKIFPSCFAPPVKAKHRISGVFGSQRILNGEPKNIHVGLDFAAPVGVNVRATAKGRVVLAYDEMYYNGKIVVIDHGFNVFSYYLHLSKISVKKGEFVKQGDKIGEIGTTGRSTGPHLHFEISVNNVKINPDFALKNSLCGDDK